MRYESESQTWSIAARTISQRIRDRPDFAEARALVVAAAFAACAGRDVAGMREIGGFSAAIEREIARLPERFRINHGSKLLPTTVVCELASDVGAIRREVQQLIAGA
jgi:hypothetical protein